MMIGNVPSFHKGNPVKDDRLERGLWAMIAWFVGITCDWVQGLQRDFTSNISVLKEGLGLVAAEI